MKKKSENSLKSWIIKIKQIPYELKELYKRLEYYTIKYYSVASPNFEIKTNASSNAFHNKNLYWLEKIDDVERKIKELEESLKKYDIFLSMLSCNEQRIVELKYFNNETVSMIAKKLNVSRTMVYKILNKIELICIVYK